VGSGGSFHRGSSTKRINATRVLGKIGKRKSTKKGEFQGTEGEPSGGQKGPQSPETSMSTAAKKQINRWEELTVIGKKTFAKGPEKTKE